MNVFGFFNHWFRKIHISLYIVRLYVKTEGSIVRFLVAVKKKFDESEQPDPILHIWICDAYGHRQNRRKRFSPVRLVSFAHMRILISLLVLLVVSCTTIPVDESVLLQPKQSVTPRTFERLNIDGYSLEEHFFVADDGTVLNGWFVSREVEATAAERVTVVLFGGNGFYLVHSIPFLRLYASLDVDVFMWDYRGYGLSEGEATLSLMQADALNAIDYVRATLGATGPVVAHGHSIGTFVATYAAQERELDALVLESPATNADHWLRNAIPGFVRALVNIEVKEELAELDNTPRVAGIRLPTFFAVGEEDFVTPPAMAELLFERSQASWKQLYIQPGGDHNSLPRDPGFREGFRALIDEIP